MKVVLLTNFIPPYRISFYQALSACFDELTIYISTRMEYGRSWPVDWGKLNVIPQKSVTFKRKWKHASGFTERMDIHFPLDTLNILKHKKPDWIITSELGTRTFLSIIYTKFSSDTKLAIWATLSERTEIGRGFFRQCLRKWLIPKADLIFTNGESGERYIQEFGFSKEKIVRIPCTIDPEQFINVKLADDSYRFHRLLISGQLIERKGIIEFLSVFMNWAKSHSKDQWTITLIGEGPLRQAISDFPLVDNVKIELVGNVPYSDLSEYYAKAGALVFPTLADEWGVVVNEAMACGLPVLGSKYSQAVEELIINGINGWKFNIDSPMEILKALDDYYISRERLANFVSENKNKIREISPLLIATKMASAIKKYKLNNI